MSTMIDTPASQQVTDSPQQANIQTFKAPRGYPNVQTHIKKLLVVSHVIHYRHGGKLYAYGPYAREIDIWADIFPKVTIAAPCREQEPPGDAQPFTRANIGIAPQPETGGDNLLAKLRQVLLLPVLALSLAREIRRTDAVHVRCPGNLGLLGVLLAPLLSRYMTAKYAGQWNGYEGEPATVRLQRKLLASRWWRGPVTVYGTWPNQPAHVIPFFTSMMTAEQVRRAVGVANTKSLSLPLRVLFSGRLVSAKRVNVLLEAVKIAYERGMPLEVAIVGHGPEEEKLRAQAAQLGIEDKVNFVGALPFEEALRWYDWAHCLVLPSTHSEGWPKVIAEAMCSGLVCVAVRHGQVPTMLEGRGILVREGTAEEFADALEAITREPETYEAIMQEASRWARQYSLEGLRDANAELLARFWGRKWRKSA